MMDDSIINLDEALIGAYLFNANRQRSPRFPWSHQEEISSGVNGDEVKHHIPRDDVTERPQIKKNTEMPERDEHRSSESPENGIPRKKYMYRGRETNSTTCIQTHIHRINPAHSISAAVSARVYSVIFPEKSKHQNHVRPKATASWDHSQYSSKSFSAKTDFPIVKPGKGLGERMANSVRVSRVQGKEVLSKRNLKDCENQEPHSIELSDIEKEIYEEFDIFNLPSPKPILINKTPSPNICVNKAPINKSTEDTKLKPDENTLNIRNIKTNTKKRKKQKKMKSAKVVPINITDDKFTNKFKSKEYLEKIARMFCVEERPEKSTLADEDSDLYLTPGIWGCDFIISGTCHTEEPCNVVIQERMQNKHSDKQDHVIREKVGKKKKNRVTNFFRNLFKKK